MKSRVMILTALAILIFGTSAFASPYVTDVTKYKPGTNVSDARDNIAEAIGAPDDIGPAGGINFLSLGLGGYAEFDFGTQFSGWATIYETTYAPRSGYYEYAEVFGSADGGTTWDSLGTINNQSSDPFGGFTIHFNGTYSMLQVLDTTLDGPNPASWGDGFDIDAIKVNPTPIPGAAWLLGTGLFGLVGLRRKFI